MEMAQQSQEQLDLVVDEYQRVLSSASELPPLGKPEEREPSSPSPAPAPHAGPSIDEIKRMRKENNQKMIKEMLGTVMYDEVYEYLMGARGAGQEDGAIQKGLRSIVGERRKLMNACFQLDMIVFHDLIRR